MTENLKFKRSVDLEKVAAQSIIGLFTDALADTSQKNAREIMVLVLLQMQAACLRTEEEVIDEHLQILHANQYFDKLIKELESSEPFSIAIDGNTSDDMINNLKKIKKAAASEEYAEDIIKRINCFLSYISQVRKEQYGERG